MLYQFLVSSEYCEPVNIVAVPDKFNNDHSNL